jgi:hypothetical protein
MSDDAPFWAGVTVHLDTYEMGVIVGLLEDWVEAREQRGETRSVRTITVQSVIDRIQHASVRRLDRRDTVKDPQDWTDEEWRSDVWRRFDQLIEDLPNLADTDVISTGGGLWALNIGVGPGYFWATDSDTGSVPLTDNGPWDLCYYDDVTEGPGQPVGTRLDRAGLIRAVDDYINYLSVKED